MGRASIASPTALQAATCRLTQPISPADCNNNRPGAAGCCCGNRKICSAPGTSDGCIGARHTVLEYTPAAANLHDAYRVHAAQAAVHARERALALRSLAAAGIEALIIKGWAVARLYPEPGLRPYGDLDVAVHPNAYEHALAVLRPPPGEPHALDVHRGLATLDRDFEAVLARSRTVADDGLTVRLPAADDHLRYLCLHFLKHGAWRPLWLCDVSVALEAGSP